MVQILAPQAKVPEDKKVMDRAVLIQAKKDKDRLPKCSVRLLCFRLPVEAVYMICCLVLAVSCGATLIDNIDHFYTIGGMWLLIGTVMNFTLLTGFVLMSFVGMLKKRAELIAPIGHCHYLCCWMFCIFHVMAGVVIVFPKSECAHYVMFFITEEWMEGSTTIGLHFFAINIASQMFTFYTSSITMKLCAHIAAVKASESRQLRKKTLPVKIV